eukprot:s6623_g1.t2
MVFRKDLYGVPLRCSSHAIRVCPLRLFREASVLPFAGKKLADMATTCMPSALTCSHDSEWWVPLEAVSFNTAFPEPLYLKVQQDTSGEFRVMGLGVGESSDCTGQGLVLGDAPAKRVAVGALLQTSPAADVCLSKDASEMIGVPGALTPREGTNPSVGSVLHGTGGCKPCAWFWKEQGCRNGAECQHCHLCDKNEIKARRKAKSEQWKQQKQEAQLPPTEVEALGIKTSATCNHPHLHLFRQQLVLQRATVGLVQRKKAHVSLTTVTDTVVTWAA